MDGGLPSTLFLPQLLLGFYGIQPNRSIAFIAESLSGLYVKGEA